MSHRTDAPPSANCEGHLPAARRDYWRRVATRGYFFTRGVEVAGRLVAANDELVAATLCYAAAECRGPLPDDLRKMPDLLATVGIAGVVGYERIIPVVVLDFGVPPLDCVRAGGAAPPIEVLAVAIEVRMRQAAGVGPLLRFPGPLASSRFPAYAALGTRAYAFLPGAGLGAWGATIIESGGTTTMMAGGEESKAA